MAEELGQSMSRTIASGTEGYADEAPALFERYEQFDFDRVHRPVLHLLPSIPSTIIDIGAGTGRDAGHLASVGHSVLAVEPVDALRERAIRMRPSSKLQWLNDSLPGLTKVLALGKTFDVVMLNAVWMHLDEQQRSKAMAAVASLTHRGSRIFMSLRHGPVPNGRRMFDVSGDETVELARRHGFVALFNAHSESIQQTNIAAGVSWTRVVLEQSEDVV